jgi:sigma-E factor negative regulatory protein RseB
MRFLVFALLLTQAQFAAAQPAGMDALQWLQKIYAATKKMSYSGTFVYQQGMQSETSRIARLVDASGTHERLETQDGTPSEVIRDNDQVTCYLPATMTMKIDRQSGQKPTFLDIPVEQFRELTEHYNVSLGGSGRIAGYDCQTIVLEPKDKMRYGYKLWADRNSGMLLKVRTFNSTNELVEQFTFLQLKIGHVDRELLKSRFSGKGKDWRVEDSGAVETDLSQSGWSLKGHPPGFRKITEMKRTLGGTPGVGHMVLSDGLAAVSVFIAPHPVKAGAVQAGLSRQGATNVYIRQIGDHLVTVIGEAPAESIKAIANAVEYRKPVSH